MYLLRREIGPKYDIQFLGEETCLMHHRVVNSFWAKRGDRSLVALTPSVYYDSMVLAPLKTSSYRGVTRDNYRLRTSTFDIP